MTRQKAVQGVEVHDDQAHVDPVSLVTDFKDVANSEAFMNELVTIEVNASTDENQPPHIIVNVNGTNMPIMRGVPTQVKRKYVEVLARMKETRYNQFTPNPSAPDQIEMRARTALAYPFNLIEDSNPKGRAWLQHILAEPA